MSNIRLIIKKVCLMHQKIKKLHCSSVNWLVTSCAWFQSVYLSQFSYEKYKTRDKQNKRWHVKQVWMGGGRYLLCGGAVVGRSCAHGASHGQPQYSRVATVSTTRRLSVRANTCASTSQLARCLLPVRNLILSLQSLLILSILHCCREHTSHWNWYTCLCKSANSHFYIRLYLFV